LQGSTPSWERVEMQPIANAKPDLRCCQGGLDLGEATLRHAAAALAWQHCPAVCQTIAATPLCMYMYRNGHVSYTMIGYPHEP